MAFYILLSVQAALLGATVRPVDNITIGNVLQENVFEVLTASGKSFFMRVSDLMITRAGSLCVYRVLKCRASGRNMAVGRREGGGKAAFLGIQKSYKCFACTLGHL